MMIFVQIDLFFYQNANYLDVKIKPKIGFIGVAHKDNHLYFNYNINQESFDKSMNELQVFFLNLVQYILYKKEYKRRSTNYTFLIIETNNLDNHI